MLLASGQVGLTTQRAHADECVFPIGQCLDGYMQQIDDAAAGVVDTAEECLNQSPGPGHICGNYLDLARSLVSTAETLTLQCVNNYYASPCRTAWDQIQSAEAGLVTCIGLQPGPGNICGNYYSFASDLIWSEYYYALMVYGQCSSGQNSYCNTAYDVYQNALEGLSNCVNMTPGMLCSNYASFVEALASYAVATAEECASGRDATCQAVLAEIEDAIPSLLSISIGVADPQIVQTLVDVMPAPADAAVIDTAPDPQAPEPTPDLSSDDTSPDTSAEHWVALTCKAYGTARWEAPSEKTCPPLHWHNGSFHIKDMTSGWPVQTYTNYWDQVSGLSAGYGCPTANHCVKVVEGHYGATGWVGLTTLYEGANHDIVGATVKLNNSYRLTSAERNDATCHELGHVAGLGHESGDVSCMYYQADGKNIYGNSDDFNQLSVNTY